MAEWYYIGHYGQLGPLTRDQMAELIEGGVIARDTYVWKQGMSEWIVADRVAELQASFSAADPFVTPPPSPQTSPPPFSTAVQVAPNKFDMFPTSSSIYRSSLRSDKSRVVGGVLNLVLPGVGRMYLGYGALGALQLITFLFCGVGLIWSIIDGILLLCGYVKMDGYGRQLID